MSEVVTVTYQRKSAGFVIAFLINIAALFVSDVLIENLEIENLMALIFGAFLLTVFNRFLKPLLIFIALPLTIITLGLFYPLINVAILNLVDFFLTSFTMTGIFSAIVVSVIIAIINWLLNGIIDKDISKNSHIR